MEEKPSLSEDCFIPGLVTMKFGVCVPNYGETCSAEALRIVAVTAEKDGYDSLWATDHVLMPRNSGTPYERVFDSLTTLSYLAALTSEVKLGVSSLITPMRNPVVVAKQLATIDNFSNGRVLLATSPGWNEKEFSHLGSNFHNRGRRLDESIRLIRALWSGSPTYGSHLLSQKFDEAIFEPRPVQKHLTIWIGGNTTHAMKRAATMGDAWHPNVQPLDQFAAIVREFRETFPDAKDKPICARIALNLKVEKSEYLSPQGMRRVVLSSNMSQNRRILETLEGLGVFYLILVPSMDGRVSISDQEESLAVFAKEFL